MRKKGQIGDFSAIFADKSHNLVRKTPMLEGILLKADFSIGLSIFHKSFIPI
jgi:hypothetical protein